MADSKITALTSISTSTDPANDPLVIVDVSDTSMAATGTTKKVTLNQLLGASGTATLASATITGDLTVDTNTLKVDSANNRVGINTASPTDTLDVNGRVTALRYLSSSSNAALPSFAVSAGNGAYNSGTNEIGFSINSTSAMTLNSTGLGLGVSPVTALSFPIGTNKVVGQSATSSHAAGNVGSLKFGIADGGGDYSGIQIFNTHNGTYSSQDIRFFTGEGGVSVCTERMRITPSGNVGIGVQPSAWRSTVRALQIGGVGALYGSTATTGAVSLSRNAYDSATGGTYLSNDEATLYEQDQLGRHVWYNAPAGTGAITWTQAMTLDASGNLLVGKTATNLQVVGCELKANGTVFSTLVDTTNAAASSYQLYSTGAATYRFYVGMGGTVFATNTTISGISDARLKENVQDIDVGLGAILALKPRKFDWKAGKGKDIKGDRGFIAQEFETVFPNLIDEWKDEAPEGEAPYKSVRQDLIPVLVKAIQELAARVQTLETR